MVRYAAESGSALSYRDAAGTNTMSETAIDRLAVAKPVSRRPANPATVGAPALALHLDCSRAYVEKLEAEGVIQQQGDGFPLDQSRVAYLRYLRRERRQSPRSDDIAGVVLTHLNGMAAWCSNDLMVPAQDRCGGV
jgi:hypothetical protein